MGEEQSLASSNLDLTKASKRGISRGAVPYLGRERPRQRRADQRSAAGRTFRGVEEHPPSLRLASKIGASA